MSDSIGDVGDFEQPALGELTPEKVAEFTDMAITLLQCSSIEISDVISDWRDDHDTEEDLEKIESLGQVMTRLDQGEGSRYAALIEAMASSPQAKEYLVRAFNEALSAIYYATHDE